jgi:hypothetical protein
MDRPARQACEERAFRDSIGVEVRKTEHCFVEDRVLFLVLDVPIGLANAILGRAVIRHLVGALETERLGGGGAGHA